jgi:hypothetical protein
MKHDYDLFVIGAGSGGVRAARIASLAGAKVAIAEEYRIGGTCVIRGCVPKKFLVYGAEFSQMLADAPGYGWTVGNATFDWPTLRDNVQKEVTRLSGIYAANLAKAGVTTFEERAEVDRTQCQEVGQRPRPRNPHRHGWATLSTRRTAGSRAGHYLERGVSAREAPRARAHRRRRIRGARVREYLSRPRLEGSHSSPQRQDAARLRR